MSLSKTLERRGYAFRQHLEEIGWTRRKLTAVDLDDAHRAALAQGGIEGLQKALAAQGSWTFPATDIAQPLPVRADLIVSEAGRPAATVVAPAAEGASRRMARALVEAVQGRFGIALDLRDGDRAGLELLRTGHVVLFGGSHESRFGMDLALRYQTGFVDATTPGEGGWAVTTHAGLNGDGHNVLQIAASPAQAREAMACALERVSAEAGA